MYRFKRIVVSITLGDQDEAKLRYTGMVSRLASTETVYFLHVIGSSDGKEETKNEYKGIQGVTGDAVHERMKELVAKYFEGSPETKQEYMIMEDAPLIHIDLLRKFKDMDIDLLVLGKIRSELTKRTIPAKIARKAPCSVLFIPEGMKPEFSNILVPIDFSEISRDALDIALSLASAANLDTVRCINIYDVPSGYHKSGKSYEQFAEIMKGHAETHFAKFIERINRRNITVSPVYKLGRSVCKAIDEYVREHYVDLLIIGGRGRRSGAVFVLGSVTEKLIDSTSMPLLAVKKKGEGMTVFEALMRL
ncbi:MAG TPA: universal stress protein [Deltaproteobacteria bacterium]|mgnify:CR=1 FL=1|nr:universal stress protein [Deltaproteobacteria bacterium]